MSNQLALKSKDAILSIGDLVADARSKFNNAANELERGYIQACSISQLQRAFTPEILAPFKALCGSRLGFKADKQYDDETIKSVIIEASLRGLRPYGNEFNIIGGNLYATQEGLERLVAERVDSGTIVEHKPELPIVEGSKWSCHYAAKFTHGGKQYTVDRTFSGKWNAYASDDQVIGKCRRKALHEIYKQLTGLSLGEGSVDEREVRNVTPDQTGKAQDAFELAPEEKP